MEKKVYCIFGERCKCIRYVNQPNETDIAAVKRALLESTATDPLLLATMKGKSIILQKQDPDRNNRLCDIDDDEQIPNKEEISVLFIALPESSDLNTPGISRNIKLDESLFTLDIPIIYKESSAMTEGIQTVINDAVTENEGEIIDLDAQLDKSKLVLEESSSSDIATNISSMHQGKKCVSYPAHLPQLTPRLQNILETVGVFNGVKDFIYFWASYLLDVTDNQPSKQDYQNLAMTIVETYPSLKGGINGCGIVKTQLSTNIRNRRANLKRKLLKTDDAQKPKHTTNEAVLIPSKKLQETNIEAETSIKMLQKKDHAIDSSHVRRLMQETLFMRRSWIEKEAKELSEIIFEFITWKKLHLENIFEKIDTLIKTMATYYSIEAITEVEKASVIVKLYDDLAYKKTKKKAIPLFIVKEMMASTEDLIGEKGDSPRAVIYIAEEGVASAFVVADTHVRVKIPNPTVAKTVMGLLAIYYIWDTAYPLAYANVMSFIDHKILGTDIKNHTIHKFIRKINQKN